MKWVLVLWIFECSGLDCPIPESTELIFETKQECSDALDIWVSMEKRRGICIRAFRDE